MFAILHHADFPFEDVNEIAARLVTSGAIVPGYRPPPVGALSFDALKYEQSLGKSFLFLPDRNLVSRMVRAADGRERWPLSKTASLSANVMAFAQTMNININPSIAFHELAHREGNAVAHRELSHFRGADAAQPNAWVNLAMDRQRDLPNFEPAELTTENLAHPLNRWRKNYVVALQIANLELADHSAAERAEQLLQWMDADYFVAGPALLYGLMYFSPKAEKAGLFKQLRSSNRERAIAGIKNAAWDMTHLSEFIRLVQDAFHEGDVTRYLFVSGDARLVVLARLLFSISDDEEALEEDVFRVMMEWWPATVARQLATSIKDLLIKVGVRPPPKSSMQVDDPIEVMIEAGEKKIWSYPRL